MKRRTFLGVIGSGCLFPGLVRLRGESTNRAHPFSSFDRVMEEFMKARDVPGGALAVVKDQRLVHARGYGWANREKKVAVTPTSLFRIASISKPITAVAIMKLVEEGKLTLEAKAFDLIDETPLSKDERKCDPRLKRITVRHLLQHTGGWDRDKSYDAMFRSRLIADAAGMEGPADAKTVIRYMLNQPLDFEPGTQYAYSNFGYCVLGRIVEKLTGKTYDTFVKRAVLAPMGIKQMRLGESLESGENEVTYYHQKGAKIDSVFPTVEGKVPAPYGSFFLEAMDAHGGWVASAVDLARFASALDQPDQCPILKPETLKQFYLPPAPPVARGQRGELKPVYYGCGWQVRPVSSGKANYWHNGSLPGTYALLVRRWDKLSWAVLFNQRSEDRSDGAIDGALHRAAADVENWREENLFSQFS